MVKRIKGTRDILPADMPKWHAVEQTAREVFAVYGFEEIRTPIFEQTELFARSIGESTDIVEKEMYTFRDRQDRSLTLRPEMTAPVVRAYIENNMKRDQEITRLYYLGPMFRYERPQKGRYRQFYQIGAEVLGSDHPAIEAEVVEMLHLLLKKLAILDTDLLINSIGCAQCRPKFLATLRAAAESKRDSLCGDCRRRITTNVLRVLDCKVESCQRHIEQLPVIVDSLCDACDTHFGLFKRYLQSKGIDYRLQPRLVRGLDYYVRTTFEITSSSLGAQNALLGGGRYDGLSEMLGGSPTQGFGFAMGLDRFVLALPEESSKKYLNYPDMAIITLGEDTFEKGLQLSRRLRHLGIHCRMDYGSRSIKAQLKKADRLSASKAVIIGEDELRRGLLSLKDMKTGTQETLTEEELLSRLGSAVSPKESG